MLIGAHAVLYSTNAEADREFLREVLGLPHVDVGEGWLIFGLTAEEPDDTERAPAPGKPRGAVP